MSSFHSLYESVATSPWPPSSVFPGIFAKSSHIDFARPSALGEPSIWKAAKGKKEGAEVQSTELVVTVWDGGGGEPGIGRPFGGIYKDTHL